MPQVLIVEDDITLRTALVHQLDRLGVKCDSAANGHEAIRRVRSWRYELIFMDLNMPEMDGLEAIAAIRAHEMAKNLQPVSIVALSGSGMKEEALALGATEYFEKPALREDLQMLLDRYLPPDKRHPYEGHESTA
jgi:CheY-like chemotaxis protein